MTLDKTRLATFGICKTYGFKTKHLPRCKFIYIKYPPVKLSFQEPWQLKIQESWKLNFIA